MTSFDKSLTANDVARILQIGRNTVYELAKSGELRSYKMGRKLLFTLDDVNEYFDRISGKRSSVAAAASKGSMKEAVAALNTRDKCLTLAGEGSMCALVAGLLQEKGLTVSQLCTCDYAALVNLYTGAADAAIITLYDQKTNSCNTPFVQRLIPGTPLLIIRMSTQPIGLIVAQGNPKKVCSWGALFRRNCTIANRPRGSKERMLLDEKIISFELTTQSVRGYDHEAATEFDAADLVSNSIVDACIGTAQTALLVKGVQFIPLQTVTTDLIVLKNERTRPVLRALKSAVASAEFRALYEKALPFDTSNMGSITYEV